MPPRSRTGATFRSWFYALVSIIGLLLGIGFQAFSAFFIR